MKYIDDKMLSELQRNGASSKRRRANLNFHEHYDAHVQRLFISMEADSYVRPHFHPEPHKWEFFLVIKGVLDFLIFDEEGKLTERISLDANGPNRGVEIPHNTWHSTVAMTDSAQFLEVKQGPYTVASDKCFATWSPPEDAPEVPEFLAMLKKLTPGEKADLS